MDTLATYTIWSLLLICCHLSSTVFILLRTVLHVLWLKLLNLLISHPSSDLCTESRLMNALNINSFHSPTKFLQPANLTTYTMLSLFSLQVELAPRLLSSKLYHPYLPHYKSPTALLYMNHLTRGISSLLHSINLILFTLLLVHPHPVHITSSQSSPPFSTSITPSTFHSRLKTHLIHKSFPP